VGQALTQQRIEQVSRRQSKDLGSKYLQRYGEKNIILWYLYTLVAPPSRSDYVGALTWRSKLRVAENPVEGFTVTSHITI
jgi:hypothetical protein